MRVGGGTLLQLDTTAAVETPERVRFRYRLSGPGRRFVAWLIDLAIRAAVVLLVVLLSCVLFTWVYEAVQGASVGLVLLVLFVSEWLYGAIFETLMGGRTPGKLAVSLRVVRLDGAPGRFPDFLLRNLVKGVDFLPVVALPGFPLLAIPTFGVSLATMMLDDRMRRLGDMVAGTVVVVEERGALQGRVVIDPPVSDAEREALPARVELSREEVVAIEAFLRRRRRMSKERAEEVAELLGRSLASRTGIQAPSYERLLTLAYARATGKDR